MMPGEVKVAKVFLAFERVVLPGGALRDGLQGRWDGGDAWVLGHAHDGVLWGVVREGKLIMASDVLEGAKLRAETLLDITVFNAGRELRVWRVDDLLEARDVREAETGERFDAVQERFYELLRAHGQDKELVRGPGGFVELRGSGGQRHTPPGDRTRPQRLRVRHYLRADDDTGLLGVAEHRMLGIEGEEW